MPMETKNNTANASRKGSDSSAARALSWTRSGSCRRRTRPARMRPQTLGRGKRHAECDRQHGQTEELARSGVRNIMQDPGNGAAPHHQMNTMKAPNYRRSAPAFPPIGSAEPRAGIRWVQEAGEGGNQHQRDHCDEVLNDQPTHGSRPVRYRGACGFAAHAAARRACDRQSKTEHKTAPEGNPMNHAMSRQGPRRCDLRHDGRITAFRNDNRSFSEKCRPTPKHQKDHAISQAGRQSGSAMKPGVNGPRRRRRGDSRRWARSSGGSRSCRTRMRARCR